MSDAIAFFAIRLICGMGLMLCVMPRRDVPSPFFRIMLLVVLGLAALFAMSSRAIVTVSSRNLSAGTTSETKPISYARLVHCFQYRDPTPMRSSGPITNRWRIGCPTRRKLARTLSM